MVAQLSDLTFENRPCSLSLFISRLELIARQIGVLPGYGLPIGLYGLLIFLQKRFSFIARTDRASGSWQDWLVEDRGQRRTIAHPITKGNQYP